MGIYPTPSTNPSPSSPIGFKFGFEKRLKVAFSDHPSSRTPTGTWSVSELALTRPQLHTQVTHVSNVEKESPFFIFNFKLHIKTQLLNPITNTQCQNAQIFTQSSSQTQSTKLSQRAVVSSLFLHFTFISQFSLFHHPKPQMKPMLKLSPH